MLATRTGHDELQAVFCVLSTVALAVTPGLITPERTRAAGAPGPYERLCRRVWRQRHVPRRRQHRQREGVSLAQLRADDAGRPRRRCSNAQDINETGHIVGSLNYATANGSAKSVEDYNAASGALSFAAGQTSKTVSVAVKGDRKREGDEVFYVNLSALWAWFATTIVKREDAALFCRPSGRPICTGAPLARSILPA